ncbi:MAG TPA: HEPN domain-containing protein [Actinocrinis sp.]|nr:HEPN domain-containing protein [Actinocrinis sp.]
MRWNAGEAIVERQLQERHLEKVIGAKADGEPWLKRARRILRTAQGDLDEDPASAYVLAYDAARQGCTALLAQQGLRPTSRGGHYAVEEAVRAQFGRVLREFGVLRKRRNELEYPEYPDEEASREEAQEAVQIATGIVDAAEKILPQLGIF